jgi:cob(I)alamin adenosyltransferase
LVSVKIYTKTGDKGDTSLLGGDRVRKDAIRVVAYGDVDETNAAIGVALATEPVAFERPLLESIQSDLLAIGGRLASPAPELVAKALRKAVIPAGRIGELETAIDQADSELDPLHEFILPGGTSKAAQLHLARTVCRRAERRVVTLQRESSVDPEILRYLNRLSDLLFMLARLANHRAGVPDVKW